MSQSKKSKTDRSSPPSLSSELSLSDTEIQRQLGHRLRRPLINIIEYVDMLMTDATAQQLPDDFRTTLGEIGDEAYRLLDMWDWLFALSETVLTPDNVDVIETSSLTESICSKFVQDNPVDAPGYRLFWSIPETLPNIQGNAELLRRAVGLAIQFLGRRTASGHVQLRAVADSTTLTISLNTNIEVSAQRPPETELLIIAAVMRLMHGSSSFQTMQNSMNLTLLIPVIPAQ